MILRVFIPLLLLCGVPLAIVEKSDAPPQRVVVDHAGNGDFLTIQEGVDAVGEGGLVSVLHGDYDGFRVTGKSVRVIGAPPIALADDVRTTVTSPVVVEGLESTQFCVVADIEAFLVDGAGHNFPLSYRIIQNQGPVFFSHTVFGAFAIEDSDFVSINRHRAGGRINTKRSRVYVGESALSSDLSPTVFVDGGFVALNSTDALRFGAPANSTGYPYPVVVGGKGTFYHDRKGIIGGPERGQDIQVLEGEIVVGGFNYMDLEYDDGSTILMRGIADRDGLYAATAVSLFRGAPVETVFGEYWLADSSAQFLTDQLLDGSSFPFHYELDTVVEIPSELRPSRLNDSIRNNAPGAKPLEGIPYVIQGIVVGPDGIPQLTSPAFGVL